jgi:hypothetical protein
MREFDESFSFGPKTSRVYRGRRAFQGGGAVLKENKRIIFRAGSPEPLAFVAPEYFCEMIPEYYGRGPGFWPRSRKMAEYRKTIDADPKAFGDLAKTFSGIAFKTECEYYKRKK